MICIALRCVEYSAQRSRDVGGRGPLALVEQNQQTYHNERLGFVMAASSLSKKHFIAIANLIREHSADREAFTLRQVEWIADFLASCNPRFNRSRFLGYIEGSCGPCGGAR